MKTFAIQNALELAYFTEADFRRDQITGADLLAAAATLNARAKILRECGADRKAEFFETHADELVAMAADEWFAAAAQR
jgi:propanediol dehydratase small subunit